MQLSSPMNDHVAQFVDYLTSKGLSRLTISAYRSDLAQLSLFLGRRKLVAASSIVRFTFAGSLLRFGCIWFLQAAHPADKRERPYFCLRTL
jgi:site-specific recombinase XerD